MYGQRRVRGSPWQIPNPLAHRVVEVAAEERLEAGASGSCLCWCWCWWTCSPSCGRSDGCIILVYHAQQLLLHRQLPYDLPLPRRTTWRPTILPQLRPRRRALVRQLLKHIPIRQARDDLLFLCQLGVQVLDGRVQDLPLLVALGAGVAKELECFFDGGGVAAAADGGSEGEDVKLELVVDGGQWAFGLEADFEPHR